MIKSCLNKFELFFTNSSIASFNDSEFFGGIIIPFSLFVIIVLIFPVSVDIKGLPQDILSNATILAPSDIEGKTIMILPGSAFDQYGNRAGYGKGYYDRFLSGYKGACIGLGYSTLIKDGLPHGKYDRKVDIIVTEKDNYFCWA